MILLYTSFLINLCLGHLTPLLYQKPDQGQNFPIKMPVTESEATKPGDVFDTILKYINEGLKDERKYFNDCLRAEREHSNTVVTKIFLNPFATKLK